MAKWEVWVTGDAVNVRERRETLGDYQVFRFCGDGYAARVAREVVALGDISVEDMRAALAQYGRMWEDRTETLAIVLGKATLLAKSEFGFSYRVLHVRDLRVHIGMCAQHTHAVHASFVVKGQRKQRLIIETYNPSLIVLEGWVNVDVGDMYGEGVTENGATAKMSRHLGFSNAWGEEARAAVKASGAKVVRDFRGHASVHAA